MIVIYTPGASIDNGVQGPVTVQPFPDQCMSRHVLKVNLGRHWPQPSAQIELRCGIEWDGACGFECTTTLPAPKKN